MKAFAFSLITILALSFPVNFVSPFPFKSRVNASNLKMLSIMPVSKSGIGNAFFSFQFGEPGQFQIKIAIKNEPVPPLWNSNEYIYQMLYNSTSQTMTASKNIQFSGQSYFNLYDTPYFLFIVRGVDRPSYISTYFVRLYPKTEKRVLMSLDSFETDPNIISSINGNVYQYSEKYSFYGFKEYIESSSNFRFSLSNYGMIYKCDYNNNTLGFTSGNFIIDDIHGLFPNLPLVDGSMFKRYVPIQLENVKNYDGFYRFLTPSLFYNPNTYEMSLFKSLGYKETSYFYFPKNSYEEAYDLKYYFEFKNVGLNEVDLYHEFTQGFEKHIIGDCHNSEYCTLINESNETPGYEEVVVVNT